MERVRERYSWDAVTDAYEALLIRLAGRKALDAEAQRRREKP